MSMRVGSVWLAVSVLLALTLTSCGTQEGGPHRGSAEWFIAEAETSYGAGDYDGALENLDMVAGSKSELAGRATLWMLAINGGLARGYKALGDAYAKGAEKLKDEGFELLPHVQQYRRDARRYAIAFTEEVGPARQRIGDSPTVSLQFPFPEGKAEPSEVLENLAKGEKPNPAQLQNAVPYAIQRGFVLQATAMAGVGEDAEQARKLFQTPPVEVPAVPFQFALGDSLWQLSELFGRDELNEPNVQGAMLNLALQCLGPALQSEDEAHKDLKKKAEDLKKEIEEIKQKRQI